MHSVLRGFCLFNARTGQRLLSGRRGAAIATVTATSAVSSTTYTNDKNRAPSSVKNYTLLHVVQNLWHYKVARTCRCCLFASFGDGDKSLVSEINKYEDFVATIGAGCPPDVGVTPSVYYSPHGWQFGE